MASIPVTLVGVAYGDKTGNPPMPVTIVAEMYATGVGVGGGPMPGGPFPAHPIAPGGQPPGIWPSPGYPAHPIAPGGQPPGIWGGGNQPFPTPPIFLPPEGPPPTGTPDDDGFIKPPPAEGGWAYHEDYGWMFSPSGSSGGKPQPGGPTPPPAVPG